MEYRNEVLPNGICIHAVETDFARGIICFRFPIGHLHAVNDIPPGAPHLLEHALFPRPTSPFDTGNFIQRFGLKGVTLNATTDLLNTDFELSGPSEILNDVACELVEHMLTCKFEETDLEHHRAILAAESRSQGKWSPYDSYESMCVYERWWSTGVTRRDLFGTKQDRRRTKLFHLERLRESYWQRGGTCIFSIGKAPSQELVCKLREVHAVDQLLPKRTASTNWGKSKVVSLRTKEIDEPTYKLAILLPRSMVWPFNKDISCLWNFSVDDFCGPLYWWLRDELGYCYGLEYEDSLHDSVGQQVWWLLSIPAIQETDIAHVRLHLPEIWRNGVANDHLFKQYIDRRLSLQSLWPEIVEDIYGKLINDIAWFGTYVSEKKERELLLNMREQHRRLNLFDRFMRKEDMGELVICPA